MKLRKDILVLAAVFLMTYSNTAQAYLDPGTGSMVFQMLIAGFCAIAFAIKMFWRNIINFFLKLFGKNKAEEENTDGE